MQAMSTCNTNRIHDKYDNLFTDLEKMYNATMEHAPGVYMRRYQTREHAPNHLQPMQDPRSAPEPPNLSYMYCSGESESMHASVTGFSGTTPGGSSSGMARGTAAVSTQASTDNLGTAPYYSSSSVYSASTRSTRSGVQHNLFSTRYDRSMHTPYYTQRTADDAGGWESWENFTSDNAGEDSATSLETAASDIPNQALSLVRTVSLNNGDDEPRLAPLTRAPRREDGTGPRTGSRRRCFWEQWAESFRQRRQARQEARQAEKEAERVRKATAKERKNREKAAEREWAAQVKSREIAASTTRARIESQMRRQREERAAWEKQLRKQIAADRAAAEREGRVYRFPLD